jgi:hypothetical protein
VVAAFHSHGIGPHGIGRGRGLWRPAGRCGNRHVRQDVPAADLPELRRQLIRGYFTVGLATLILEDRASAAKRGEPPALDGDPFVGHQEWDISNLAIEVKDTGGLKAVGTVTFTNAGKPEKVVVEMLRSGKDWRIADIQWDASSLRALYRKKATVGDAYPVR